MLSQHAAAHRAVEPAEDQPDRSMQILQYATAVIAILAAALLAVVR
jgi:dTDP-4-dehydrorhamnose reductase